MTREFSLDGGGSGRLELLDGDRVVVRGSRAAPPGSTLVARFAELDEALQLKVKSCRLDRTRGDYTIEGRAIDLSRDARDRIAAGR